MVISSIFCHWPTNEEPARLPTARQSGQSDSEPNSSSAPLSLQGASLSAAGVHVRSPGGAGLLNGVAATQSETKSLRRHLRLHAVPAITHISASANKRLRSVSDGRRAHTRQQAPPPLHLVRWKRGRRDKRPAVIIQGGRLILLHPGNRFGNLHTRLTLAMQLHLNSLRVRQRLCCLWNLIDKHDVFRLFNGK